MGLLVGEGGLLNLYSYSSILQVKPCTLATSPSTTTPTALLPRPSPTSPAGLLVLVSGEVEEVDLAASVLWLECVECGEEEVEE